MLRLAVMLVAAWLAAPAARAACAEGVYRSPSAQAVIITNPAGAPASRYLFVDGRRGSVTDADSQVRCTGEALTVAGEAWTKEALRLTPTRFRSGDLILNGLLIEPPPGPRKPPLTVLVHGSESTAAVGGYYPYVVAAQGISAFVFDKRGTGASQGHYTQNFQWLADDVVAAAGEARRLAKGRYSRLGLFGGSQGGWVAPLAANRAKADFVAVGFGLVLSPVEEDAEQVFDEMRRKGYDAAAIAKAHVVTKATGDVVASHFTSGFERLAQVKQQYAAEPWFGQINGEFTGEVLRTDAAGLRAQGPAKLDNLNIVWRYDAVAALRAVKAPQVWIMAGEDTAAPGSLSRDRLAALRREGKAIEVYVFPKTDHGIYEYIEAPDGSRKTTRMADGYLRLLADWIKRDLHPPYGAAVKQDAP